MSNFSSLITTILICNNIVNILATSISAYLFTKEFDSTGLFISTVIMTAAILIFGEIFPKIIARNYPETVTMYVCSIFSILIKILKPITIIVQSIENLFKEKPLQQLKVSF
ncbi:MAG: CNNM domain-containing protein [Bacilli bacterium]